MTVLRQIDINSNDAVILSGSFDKKARDAIPQASCEESKASVQEQAVSIVCTDELEDQLDQQGVPTELLEDWKSREVNAYAGVPCQAEKNLALPANLRDVSLRFISRVARLADLPESSWFDAVTLFDIYCAKVPHSNPLRWLCQTCVALVKILKKADCQTHRVMHNAHLEIYTKEFAGMLEGLGNSADDISTEYSIEHELAVMDILAWQIHVPSVASWIQMYCTRFDVFARELLSPSLKWVFEQSMFYARMITMWKASSADFPPRHIAVALLGLHFVSARLLPLESMRDQSLTPSEWEALFSSCQIHGNVASCALPKGHSHRVLKLLQVTTGCSLAEIQTQCKLMATVMKSALVEIQRAYCAHQGNATSI